jgi:hypothetical protein
MSVETPFENPEAYDSITLDGVDTPGLCTFKGGGDRKRKIESQQAPGFGGAFTLDRGEEVPSIDYEIHVWTLDQYKALQVLAAKLRQTQKSRPPKVIQLVDLAIAHNEIARVVCEVLGAFQSSKPGRWFLPVKFIEWRKRKPLGGVPKSPLRPAQELALRIAADTADLTQQFKAMEIAAERGL